MPVECSCGKFYQGQNGVDLCERNRHYDGKYRFEKHDQFRQTIEQEFSVVCADCQRNLLFRMRIIEGSMIEFNVVPHACEVAEDGGAN